VLDENNLPPTLPDSKRTGYTYEGKEIIAIRRQGRKPAVRNPDFYTQDQKVDACTLYAVYGDIREVTKLTDVPEKILRQWKEEPWWFEIQKTVFVEQNERLSARISNVLDKAIDQIADRLDNGDQTYNPKTGEITRKPIEARVLASLFETLSHQRRITRGEPTNITAKLTVDENLKRLEEAFKRFAQATEITGEYNAIESRKVEKDCIIEHSGIPQGEDLCEDEGEVWEENSGQTGSSGSDVEETSE